MGQEPHRATTRALDILEYLADVGGAGSTLTELAAALDAPKSSLFPIVHTLAERRYIRLDRETGAMPSVFRPMLWGPPIRPDGTGMPCGISRK